MGQKGNMEIIENSYLEFKGFGGVRRNCKSIFMGIYSLGTVLDDLI